LTFRFDDPNLAGAAGLVPVVAIAARCGPAKLAGRLVTAPRWSPPADECPSSRRSSVAR